MEFNLIVSTFRRHELDAQDEFHNILRSFGDQNTTSQITRLPGILIARTNLDPFVVIKKMREFIHDEPWNIRFILRMIPIEITLPGTAIGPIKQAVKKLSSKMKASDTFRITVERRDTSLTSSELISNIGSVLDNTVNLESPHWTVLVEIIGKTIGISILRPTDIFSFARESRHEL